MRDTVNVFFLLLKESGIRHKIINIVIEKAGTGINNLPSQPNQRNVAKSLEENQVEVLQGMLGEKDKQGSENQYPEQYMFGISASGKLRGEDYLEFRVDVAKTI